VNAFVGEGDKNSANKHFAGEREEKHTHEREHSRCEIGSLQKREDGTRNSGEEHDERDDTQEDSHFLLLCRSGFLQEIYYTILAVVSREDGRFTIATHFGTGKIFQSFLLLSLDFLFGVW
jgi:hypothetical protein